MLDYNINQFDVTDEQINANIQNRSTWLLDKQVLTCVTPWKNY